MVGVGAGVIGKKKRAVLSLDVVCHALAVRNAVSSAILVNKRIEMGRWSEQGQGIVGWMW
jgi:hypothetical protein